MAQDVERTLALQFLPQGLQHRGFRLRPVHAFQSTPLSGLTLPQETVHVSREQGPFFRIVRRISPIVAPLGGQAVFDCGFKGALGVGWRHC